MERATQVFWREVVEPAEGADAGLDRLRALYESYLRYLERDTLPGGCFLSAATAEFDGRPGPVRDAIVSATRAWGRELLSQAKLAAEHDALPAGIPPEQVVFEISAFANQANAAYQLEGDRRVFERARAAAKRVYG